MTATISDPASLKSLAQKTGTMLISDPASLKSLAQKTGTMLISDPASLKSLAQKTGTMLISDPASLKSLAQKTETMLKERQYHSFAGVPPEVHQLPPFISKSDWSKLGDALKKAEQPSGDRITGDKWISLRCDGTGFSKLTKHLRRQGVISQGYSEDFGSIMQSCCLDLMTKFNGACGYTQSDELTILVAPASIVRGEQQPHMYSGRLQKLCSLAAATVTARFQYELVAVCHKKGVDPVSILQSLPTFDCRVGQYDTQLEAISLILWRGYDCSINAVSDGVLRSGLTGCKQMMKKPTGEKLVWLHSHNLLPLHRHQREGTYIVKVKRLQMGKNQKTGDDVSYLRSRIEPVHGNVLRLFKEDKLFPEDDSL